jgi:predicted ATPase/DNA-binding CsgD family transcriptional regulator
VGRTRELADVCELIGARGLRLVTLTGPGGVGKTRLVLAIARHRERAFSDGIAFVSLETTTDPSHLPVAIAQACGVPDVADQSLSRRMRDFFSQRRMLLVLDNLEHLAEAGTYVADLLADSQHVRLLCTSRTPLHIAGEQTYPVPPLDPADAAILFGERARVVEPGFAAVASDIILVDRVCERLEYLPLAIELAAARIDVLPLPALIDRLDHQLSVLTGGPHNAARRHRTMRDAIAWSHDLLDPADHILLRRLAVCSGGFSLDAARDIANEGIDALDGVSRLVASGLVRRVPGPGGDARFRLPVSIREFAQERLQDHGELAALRTRHSLYYCEFAEAACLHYDGPDVPAWRERTLADLDNCRAAMAWAMDSEDWETGIRLAGALWRIWWPSHAIGGKAWTERVAEGLAWIERALPHRQDMPVHLLADALVGAGHLNILLGRLPEARAHASGLLQLSEAQSHPYGEFWACFQLGRIALIDGDYDAARSWLERAIDAAPLMRNSENHAATALGLLADVAKADGDDREALRLVELGMAGAYRCGNPHLLSWLGLVTGRLRLKLVDPREAVHVLIESINAYAANSDKGGIRASLTELGRVALALDQLDTAGTLLGAAHDLPAHTHDRPVHEKAVAELSRRLGKPIAAEPTVVQVDPSLDDLLDLARSLATAPALASLPGGLSSRESDVLRHLAEGHSNRAIADLLSISERTVENHVYHILAKLDLDSRTAAATWALRHGLA